MNNSSWIIFGETVVVCVLCFVLFHGCNKTVVVDNHKADSIEAVSKVRDSLFKVKTSQDSILIHGLRAEDSLTAVRYSEASKAVAGQSQKIIGLIADVNKLKNQGTDSLQNAISDLSDQEIQLLADVDNQKQQMQFVIDSKDSLISNLASELKSARIQVDSVVKERDALYLEFTAQAKIEIALQKKSKLNNLWAKVSTVALVIVGSIALLKH
jgi:hypothetical protein